MMNKEIHERAEEIGDKLLKEELVETVIEIISFIPPENGIHKGELQRLCKKAINYLNLIGRVDNKES